MDTPVNMIVNLPNEVILRILETNNISFEDIGNFSSTCTKFQWIIGDNNLWRKKIVQKWPSAATSYKDKMRVEFYHANVEDVKEGIKCAKLLRLHVSRMSEMYYHCNDRYRNKNIFKKVIKAIFRCPAEKKHALHFSFLFDELVTSIYKQERDPRQCNLTERYYNIQMFQCVNRYIFKSNWKNFENKPEQQQRLEDIIVIILQWYHPDKYITDLLIDKFIDTFVQKVLKFLKDENTTHPIFSLPPEQFSIWKNNNIDKNYWSEEDAKSIKHIIDKTIIKFDSSKLWMELNEIDMDSYHYSIQDKEMHFKYLFWLIISTCVARRLGIYFEIIGVDIPHPFYLNCYLAWKPREDTKYTEYFRIHWIDDQDSIKISDIKEERLQGTIYYIKLSSKLITNILMELLGYYCLWPMDLNPYQRSFNLISSSMIYYDVSICTPSDEKVCEERSPNLKYAIGLVVKHEHGNKHIGYKNVAGVIIGWHNKCQIERFWSADVCCTRNCFESEYRLKYYNHHDWMSQPYYVLLLIDNDLCYVPQCAITSMCTSKWINNAEIGKYFCKFEGTHYVPNEMLRKHYPYDTAVICKMLSNKKL